MDLPAPDIRRLFEIRQRPLTGEGLRFEGGEWGGHMTLQPQQESNERRGAAPVEAASEKHPFKVTKDTTANHFKVLAGTCEGKTITTQTIDVGSTRPVAILAYPQYTLTIYNSQFVNGVAVKSGANAPVLVSSTTTLSDVDSGISSAGTEARALIAIIGAGDVISQITTGNITGTWAAAGLTGLAAGHFNKKA